jgi:hypothetical protein
MAGCSRQVSEPAAGRRLETNHIASTDECYACVVLLCTGGESLMKAGTAGLLLANDYHVPMCQEKNSLGLYE